MSKTVREKSCILLDLVDSDVLDAKEVVRAFISYLSEDDVRDFIVTNGYDEYPGLSDEDDADDDEEEDDDSEVRCSECPFEQGGLCRKVLPDCPGYKLVNHIRETLESGSFKAPRQGGCEARCLFNIQGECASPFDGKSCPTVRDIYWMNRSLYEQRWKGRQPLPPEAPACSKQPEEGCAECPLRGADLEGRLLRCPTRDEVEMIREAAKSYSEGLDEWASYDTEAELECSDCPFNATGDLCKSMTGCLTKHEATEIVTKSRQ